MKDLKINSTSKTPEINFNCKTGVFEISGVSVPENSVEFYERIIDWMQLYSKHPVEPTKLIFKLSYINTSSLQFIYDLMMKLDAIHQKNSSIEVDWYYLEEDNDMKEMGEDFEAALSFKFNYFEVETV